MILRNGLKLPIWQFTSLNNILRNYTTLVFYLYIICTVKYVQLSMIYTTKCVLVVHIMDNFSALFFIIQDNNKVLLDLLHK